MTPLVKDKNEAINATQESAASAPPQGRSSADQLSADAVSLEVPVNIHGSRVTDAVRGATSHTEPFEEQTTTMIVFPQGGVLRMATPVTSGQMLVLTNLKSRQDAICRVVKVRTYSATASYVEVEFTHSQAGYWGVFFSSDGPELAKKATGNTLALETADPAAETKSAAKLAQPPAPVSGSSADSTVNPPSRQTKDPSAPSTLGIPANRKESSFISIGSQEEVQLSATSTTFQSGSTSARETPGLVSPPRKEQLPPRETPSSDSAPSAGVGNRENSAAPSAQSSAGTFGEAFGSSSRLTRDAHTLESSASASTSVSGASQNWKMIVAGASLGITLAAGAFFLFRPSAESKVAKPVSAPVSPAAEVPAASSVPAPQPLASQPPVTRSAPVPSAAPSTAKNNLSADARRAQPAPAPVAAAPKAEDVPEAQPERQAAAPKRGVSDVTSNLFGSLNAHPVAGRSAASESTGGEPVFNAPAPQPSANNSPLTIPAPSDVPLPIPTQTVPGAPLPVGGGVPEPRLLTSVLPVYPAAAKQTRSEGDVVLRTTIDEHGVVANAQAVSGPPLLRQSAIDAVKHWKYEPSHVNGKPVAVQTLVTIHFRL
jgi:TonB family protein